MSILIVEDERSLRDALVDLLTGRGFAVEAVDDGIAAVERGTSGGVELVLLDLALPRLDGIEACRRMRMARPALPILILTARGSEDDRVRGLQAGADDYLTKPFGSAELLARIDALARRASITPSDAERVEIDGCILDLGRCLARRSAAVHSRHRSRMVLQGRPIIREARLIDACSSRANLARWIAADENVFSSRIAKPPRSSRRRTSTTRSCGRGGSRTTRRSTTRSRRKASRSRGMTSRGRALPR